MTAATAMRRALVLTTATTVNTVRKQGLAGFVNGVVLLPVLGMLIIGGLYQTLDGQPFDAASFSAFFPYFVGFSAFAAGAASWEAELLSGVGPVFAGRPGSAMLSRAGYVAASAAPVAALFASLRAVVSPGTVAVDLVCVVVICTGCAVLGCGIASWGGFRTDKGVNNVVQLTPWVFALGPSPLLPEGLGVLAWVFPGTPVAGSLGIEIARTAVYVAVGLMLVRVSTGPRRMPTYSP